jgi:hypothetical protein
MTDLRKAAEMALEALEDIFGKEKKDVGAINALRQALAMEKFSEANQEIEEAIKKGTKAWADVPDATKWVDELRGEPEQEREWVGITHDEVYEFVCTTDSYINLAKAIEAKLKEKNGG